MTSADIKIALSKKHNGDFFITECKSGATWAGGFRQMDAVAIKPSWANPCVTIYEVKVSRNDFLRDSKWHEYLDYCHRFYFACPKGLIKKDELPDQRVGLIYINENGTCYTAKAVPLRPVEIPASFYQYILFSRIDSERIPFYNDKAEYIEAFIENKKTATALANRFSSSLIKRLAEYEKQISEYKTINLKLDNYRAMETILERRGISLWGDWQDEFEKAVIKYQQTQEEDVLVRRLQVITKSINDFLAERKKATGTESV